MAGLSRPRGLAIGLLLVASGISAPILAQKIESGAFIGYQFSEPAAIDDDVTIGARVLRNFKERRFTAQGSFTYFKPQHQDYRSYLFDFTGSVQFRADKSLVPYLFAGPGWAVVDTGPADNSLTLNLGVGLKAFFEKERDYYLDMRTTGRWYEARATSQVDREFSMGIGMLFGSGKGAVKSP